MKIIKRLIFCLIGFTYIILVVFIPLWWFVPQLLFGKSHDTILNNYFDYIYDNCIDLYE
jgi:hypothetical protein